MTKRRKKVSSAKRRKKSTPKSTPGVGTITDKIQYYLEGAFDSVATSRKQHYEANPGERPTKQDVDDLIHKCANTNALIAGAANLIPGPWGALAILPEITMVIRNQIRLIYDLGVAHGKESKLTAELLLGVFATVSGGGAISLATVRGGQLLVRRASLRVMQQIIEWLGGKIAQRILKAFVAKWFPVVGAAAMALWARQSTIQLGEKATKMLRREIVVE